MFQPTRHTDMLDTNPEKDRQAHRHARHLTCSAVKLSYKDMLYTKPDMLKRTCLKLKPDKDRQAHDMLDNNLRYITGTLTCFTLNLISKDRQIDIYIIKTGFIMHNN